MRKFGKDGPTRSKLGDKIQYEGFMSPLTVRRFGEYMRKHQVQEDGNRRESDNWQKGIPIESYMDSLLRHMVDVWGIHRKHWALSDDGCDLEDVLCGVKFNVDGLLHELVKARLDKHSTDYLKVFDRLRKDIIKKEEREVKLKPGISKGAGELVAMNEIVVRNPVPTSQGDEDIAVNLIKPSVDYGPDFEKGLSLLKKLLKDIETHSLESLQSLTDGTARPSAAEVRALAEEKGDGFLTARGFRDSCTGCVAQEACRHEKKKSVCTECKHYFRISETSTPSRLYTGWHQRSTCRKMLMKWTGTCKDFERKTDE